MIATRIFALGVLFLGVLGTAAISVAEGGKVAATNSNQFGCDLLHRLAEKEQGNLFFSPYSVETALTMTYGGARGQTAQEMARVLHLNQYVKGTDADVFGDFKALTDSINNAGLSGKDRVFDLVVANALWAQKGLDLEPTYLKLVKDQFAGQLDQVDFAAGGASLEQARSTINDWVAKQTNDKIKDLLSKEALGADTRLVLTNAIYFKGAWLTPFSKKATQEEAFHAVAGDVNVSMMHEKHIFQYTDNADVQVVSLPYKSNRMSMVVVLPRKADALPKIEQALDTKTIDGWVQGMGGQQVDLSLPKFTFSSHFALGQVLKTMGMEIAFSNHADFSGITKSTDQSLCIGEVVHQAFVDVNEETTEAAGATGIMMHPTAMPVMLEPVVFKADHPFLFVIRDNENGAILFIGRVANPKG